PPAFSSSTRTSSYIMTRCVSSPWRRARLTRVRSKNGDASRNVCTLSVRRVRAFRQKLWALPRRVLSWWQKPAMVPSRSLSLGSCRQPMGGPSSSPDSDQQAGGYLLGALDIVKDVILDELRADDG